MDRQKYAIATMLAQQSLEATIAAIRKRTLPDVQESAIQFAKEIDKYYRKRDGFVPKIVVDICNGGVS